MSDGRTLYLRLRAGEGRATLRLFRDEARTRAVFARGGGYGLDHVERTLDDELAPAVSALARALAMLKEPAPWSRHALAALVTAARRAGGELRAHRLLLDRQALPRWSAAMRSGMPDDGGLWPRDAELAALRVGARVLLRREWATGEEAARARDTERLTAHGLTTRTVAKPDGRWIVLAAASEATIDVADAHEARVEENADGWEAAATAMGALLGYPSCCVRAFVRGRARGDASLMAERLPEAEHAAMAPESIWLDGALGLVSHVPCESTCEPTRVLASRVLAALDAERPGIADAWRALARRLHLLTPDGRMLAIAAHGALGAGALQVGDVIELVPSGDRAELRPWADVAGITLVLDGLWLGSPERPELHGTLFADHRGA